MTSSECIPVWHLLYGISYWLLEFNIIYGKKAEVIYLQDVLLIYQRLLKWINHLIIHVWRPNQGECQDAKSIVCSHIDMKDVEL